MSLPHEKVTGGALQKSFPCLRAKAAGHSWARSDQTVSPWPPARRERQKGHQQGYFHLLTKANWLLNRGYKNGPVISGETPDEVLGF
jgi:hypothetical protein